MRAKSSPPQWVVFESSMGWTGILHYQEQIQAVKFGFARHAGLLDAFGKNDYLTESLSDFEEGVQSLFLRYFAGESVDLTSLKIDTSGMSEFQQRVSQACQNIPRGKTVSYGALANSMGSPGAARAVGTAMRRNKIPLIVPCHRVLPSDGSLGQFSAGQGAPTKQRLLDLESGGGTLSSSVR